MCHEKFKFNQNSIVFYQIIVSVSIPNASRWALKNCFLLSSSTSAVISTELEPAVLFAFDSVEIKSEFDAAAKSNFLTIN